VRYEVTKNVRSSSSSARSLLRGTGRVAIWTVLGLLLIRGIVAEPTGTPPAAAEPAAAVDSASSAFAVRFARTYLANPAPAALAPFLAEGASVGIGRPPQGVEGEVAQAEVAESTDLGEGRAVLTVACELRDSRTLYLAVPIVRTQAGEVAALGAPSIVAAPAQAGADPERPRPLAGRDAGAIHALVEKFLPAYVAAVEPDDLAYLVAPGHEVLPLGGALQFDSLAGITQLDAGEGPTRSVLVAARLGDATSGATYPVVYRLDLVRRARWYVEALAGVRA
jgi:hypothetical protein